MTRLLAAVAKDISSGSQHAVDVAAASMILRTPAVFEFPYVAAKFGSKEEGALFTAALQSVTSNVASKLPVFPELRYIEELWTAAKDLPQVRMGMFATLMRSMAKAESSDNVLSLLSDPQCKLLFILDQPYKQALCTALLFEFRVDPAESQRHLCLLFRAGIEPGEVLSYAAKIPSPNHFLMAFDYFSKFATSSGVCLDGRALPAFSEYLNGRLVDLDKLSDLVVGYGTAGLSARASGLEVGDVCKELKPMAKILLNLIYSGAEGAAQRLHFAVDALATSKQEKLSDASKICVLRAISIVFDNVDLDLSGRLIAAVNDSALRDQLCQADVIATCSEFTAAKARLAARLPDGLPKHKVTKFLS
jgi:hypothetical protein